MTDPKDVGEILLIEDNPGDVRLTREMFKETDITISIHVANTGAEALDFLHRRGEYEDAPRPEFVLLDWHLPQMGGAEVLAEMRGDEALADIPVVVLTGSKAEIDILEDEGAQADDHIRKPIEPDEFRNAIDEL